VIEEKREAIKETDVLLLIRVHAFYKYVSLPIVLIFISLFFAFSSIRAFVFSFLIIINIHTVALLFIVVDAQTFFNQNRRVRSSRNFRRFLDDDPVIAGDDSDALPAAGGSAGYSSQRTEDTAAQINDAADSGKTCFHQTPITMNLIDICDQ
jgi:hypothetical protein